MRKYHHLSGEIIHKISLHVHGMSSRGQITDQTTTYLTHDTNRTHQFYLLPNFHNDAAFPHKRSIVPGSGGPTEKISICGFLHLSISNKNQSYT